MQHHEFPPPHNLTSTIKCFWHTRRDFGADVSAHEIMPDGYAELVFCFGNECTLAYNGVLQPLPSPFLIGLLSQPLVLSTYGVFEVLGVRFFPWAVFDALGLPPGNDAVRVLEHVVAQLQPVLATCVAAGKIEEAIAMLTHYFASAVPATSADATLSKAGQAMAAANGALPVSRIAAAAHAGVRTLERKFRQSAGHTVKDVSGLMRFEQARNRLWMDPTTSLAGLAQELGYTDQSHLSREFKRYSSTTPAAFARKAKKQGTGSDFVAFVQA